MYLIQCLSTRRQDLSDIFKSVMNDKNLGNLKKTLKEGVNLAFEIDFNNEVRPKRPQGLKASSEFDEITDKSKSLRIERPEIKVDESAQINSKKRKREEDDYDYETDTSDEDESEGEEVTIRLNKESEPVRILEIEATKIKSMGETEGTPNDMEQIC